MSRSHVSQLASLSLILALVGCAADRATPEDPFGLAGARLVDLTHAFDENTIYWPTDTKGFGFEEVFVGETEKGYWYEANRFATAEHGGTHLDAPVHFWKGGAAAAEIPLERLVGPGVVVDVRDRVADDRNHAVTVADLERFEAANGEIPRGGIVLLRTGIGAGWPDRKAVLGTAKTGPEAIAELSFPGLDAGAAAWLAEERAIGAIGIDTPSIDPGISTHFESHVRLFEAGIPAFENVAALDELPPVGFTVVALPMKIRGGSGGPLRIIAVLE